MYSQGNYKGAKHEWLPIVNNVGIPSYINVQDVASVNGHPVILITLCPFSYSMMQALETRAELIATLLNDLVQQVKSLKKAAKGNPDMPYVSEPEPEDNAGDDANESDGEEGLRQPED
ncbi:hypothetical protein L208DRAFT_1381045 [Tricholoma matsutake]|nr:hypothetical protein L208DRAFT_1381045 [Tricholoma matsutake 945]